MFDFVLFFLIFLPLMDIIRQMRSINQVKKVVITGLVTAAIGSYFVYTTVLAGKLTLFVSF